MSDAAVAQILTAIPIIIAALTTLIVALRTAAKVESVRKATDGMHEKLVAAAKVKGADDERAHPTKRSTPPRKPRKKR